MFLLNIPFEVKDEAKKYKCTYNTTTKLWSTDYDGDDADILAFIDKYELVYLNVDYDDKDDVKSKKARWCPINKRWFTYKGNELLREYM